MKAIKKILFTVALLTGLYASAQESNTSSPEMITDRPDATESPNVVPKKTIQVETGGFYTSFEENDVKQEVLGYNTTLLRVGLLDNLELRLGWNFEEVQTTLGGAKLDRVASGFSPLLAGMKVQIAEENGWMPTLGLLGHLYLPFTAGSDFKPETTGVDFRFAFGHTLSEKSSIAYNLGAAWGSDSPEAAYVYTFSYAYSLTDRVGLYAELYGDAPENSKANHLWDAGITYAIQNNIQLDATVGSSITDGQDLLISGGISFRLPQ